MTLFQLLSRVDVTWNLNIKANWSSSASLMSDVCCYNVSYLCVRTNDCSFLLLAAGSSSRPERPLSATRKNVCGKDPEPSVSAVVKAMQMENEGLQKDLQTISSSPQTVWQNAGEGCLIE